MESVTSADGTVIGYSKTGSGPLLVLVHGSTADHTRWDAITPRLAETFSVIAMDRRGRGASGDAAEYEIQREMEDVAAVVESLGSPVALLGHSYGALCCLGAALLTDQIDRMVLYEPPLYTGLPFYPAGFPERMQALIDDHKQEEALVTFFKEVVHMPEEEFSMYRKLPVWPTRVELAPTIPRELIHSQGYAIEPNDYEGWDVPSLLLLGGDSPAQFHNAIQRLDAILPNSRVVRLPGQQHVAMDTNKALFLEAVLGFVGA